MAVFYVELHKAPCTWVDLREVVAADLEGAKAAALSQHPGHEVLLAYELDAHSVCGAQEVKSYIPMERASRKIQSRTNQETVQDLLASAFTNAYDTVIREKALEATEWDGCFRGSLEILLASGNWGTNTKHILAWFEKHGIRP